MKDEPNLILCVRPGPDILPTIGSTEGRCSRCGATVLVSPSSWDMAEKEPCIFACVECCMAEIEAAIAGTQEVRPISDDQVYEIMATLAPKGPKQ